MGRRDIIRQARKKAKALGLTELPLTDDARHPYIQARAAEVRAKLGIVGPAPAADGSMRRRAVEAAIANARLSGVDMTPGTLAVFERFVAGEIDDEEMVRLVGVGDLSTNVSALSQASDHDVNEYRKHVDWRATQKVGR